MEHEVNLCIRLLRHSVFATHTENRKASEVREALKFFFSDEVITRALAFVTGRQLPDSATGDGNG